MIKITFNIFKKKLNYIISNFFIAEIMFFIDKFMKFKIIKLSFYYL